MILWQLSQAWLHYCLVIPRQLIVLWSCGSCLTRDIYDSMAAVSRFYGSCLKRDIRDSKAVVSWFYGICLRRDIRDSQAFVSRFHGSCLTRHIRDSKAVVSCFYDSCLACDIDDSKVVVSRYYGSCFSRGSVAVVARFYGGLWRLFHATHPWFQSHCVTILWQLSHVWHSWFQAFVSRFYGSCLSRGSVAVASRFYGNCLSVTFMVPRWLSHDFVAVVSVVVLWRVSHDITASCLRQLIRWLVFQDSGQFVLNRPCVHTAAVMDILMLFNTEKENK